jgi:hypothetical protein
VDERSKPAGWQRATLVTAVVLYAVTSAAPSWHALQARRGAKDHASFHYAAQVAADGQDPYDAPALQARADADGVRTEVYPWIYPPPALLGFSWTLPLSFAASQKLSWALNHASLAGLLFTLWRWFRPAPALIGLALVAFTPLRQSFGVGQINPTVALLAAWGFSRRSGLGLATAAWFKMSPVLLLIPWVLRRWWRPLAGVAAATAALCLLSLLLAPMQVQIRFFTDVLPALGAGAYNGMTVPLDLPANHSFANVFHQLFPSGSDHRLSPVAATLAKATSLALLLPVAWVSRTARDPLGEAAVFGALSVVMVLAPAYAYEHHLVLLLPATLAAGTAWQRQRLPKWSIALLVVGCGAMLWPLPWFRAALGAWPNGGWIIRESKLVGAVVVGMMCLIAAANSPKAAAPAP